MLCSNCHRELHERLDISRLEAKKLLAKSEMTVRNPRVSVPCSRCGTGCTVSLERSESGTPSYCSITCSSVSARKFTWPERVDLQVMIWERPATTVATELGISSSGLKRICETMGIDTPPRGYWQKLKGSKRINMPH